MTAPAAPVPFSTSEITPEWLSSILREAGALDDGQAVASVETDEISAGVGFVGVVVRLKLSYAGDAGDAPRSLVAKLASPDPGSRMIGAAFGLFERETNFYRELASSCGMPAPRCYCAHYEGASGNVCIVLEDLTEGAFGDQVKGATREEAAHAIDALARMHAKWWASPEFERLPWLKNGVDIIRQPVALMYQSSWPVALERYGHLFPPEIHEMAPTLLPRAMKGIDRLLAIPETLTHGDYRSDNLFFGADPARPVVACDWQGPARSPAVVDVPYYITGSLTIEDRRKHERDLLKRYHAGLMEGGVRDYPFESFFQHYREYFAGLPTAAGMVLLATIPEGNERGRLLIETIVQRFLAASEDHDALSLLPEA